ncbi:DUF2860 family protein [Enterovibrio norvegicus]|uniref:DUF2860 family protein n=1 Tax=Enterovibrio norvegicus TaxID=188144 RepID=UPI0013D80629|nr:DUF2860 family protein [Enterovibrio norvegicus]
MKTVRSFSPTTTNKRPLKGNASFPLLTTCRQTAKMFSIICLLTSPFATAEDSVPQGFYGSVSLFTGFSGTTSPLSTDSDAVISEYSTSENNSEVVVIPFWDVKYRLNSTSELYIETDIVGMASDFYLNAGYRHYLKDDSYLALGIVPGLLEKEVWKNPYLLNTQRETTKAAVRGVIANYNKLLGSDWSVELARGEFNVDEDTTVAELQRDATLSYAELSYDMQLNQQWGVEWVGHYLDIQSNASAPDSQRYGMDIETQYRAGRHVVMAGISSGQQNFDKELALFGRTRKDDRFGLSATYVYASPFNIDSTLMIVRGGWDHVDSNIDVYDSDNYLVTIGMQYQF